MTDIVQAVETAIHTAETAIKVDAHALVQDVEAKTIETDVERSKFVTELEAFLTKLRHPETVVDRAVTQADKDAAEDLVVIRGAFSRFVHRLYDAI